MNWILSRIKLHQAVLCVLVVGLIASCGCSSLGGKLEKPSAEWVRSNRATFDVIAPRFASYVVSDQDLDAALESNYLGLLSDWEFNLRTQERAQGWDPPPMLFPPPRLGLDREEPKGWLAERSGRTGELDEPRTGVVR